VVEAGALLDDRFLKAIQDAARGAMTDAAPADLAIIWGGRTRAATVQDLPAASFPTVEQIDADPDRQIARAVTIGGRAYYAVFTVVESHQSTLAVLAAFVPLAPVEAAHNAILSLLAVLIGILVVAITLLSYRFTTSLTHPLGQLAAAAQAVESGDLSVRIPSNAPHEIGRLERSFDTMIRSLAERDATNRQLLGELERQALFDTLTGLPNRTLLQDRLRQTILNADRQSLGFAFILLDLDRFKDINDTFGHHVGDILLRQVGPQLGEVLRESDTVSRFGGDEFALLLPTATDAAGAIQAADKVLGALQRPFVADGLSLQIEASLGIAMYPAHGADASALIQHADAAMYQAKRSKSGYAMYSVGEEEASRDRLLLLGEFRDAIQRAQLWLYYQPAVDPSTKRIIGMEALVRWQHPRLGLLPAASFIPFAEQTGLIRPLGEWVLRTAAAQSAHWTRVGIDTPISVNLSARDLPDLELPERIAQLLEAADVRPSRLRLEITESVVMSDPARSLEILGRLRDMGIDLSIDDFGTGYSSLSYLRRLPVAEIKIDRSFVTDMLSDPGAAAIVRSTIDLGHNLGLRVIAEGVESEEVAAQLGSLGCDGIQGYYVSPAMPAELVPGWIGNSQWTLDGEEVNEPVRFRPRRSL
jgi:diguanylate cyclase (GGDEF)-like protein